MAERPDHHLLTKLTVTLALAALLAALHWAVWVASTSVTFPGARLVLVSIGDFDIGLYPLLNSGSAFGPPQGVYTRAVLAGFAALGLSVFLSVLPIIPSKYSIQLVLVELLIASGIAATLERLTTGYARQYFDLGFGSIRWPVFNLYELVTTSTLASLYLLVFLRFFRLLPSFKRGRPEGGNVGQLSDPLCENRKALSAMLSLWGAGAAVMLVVNGIATFFEARQITGTGGVLAIVITTELLTGAIFFGPLILCWRLIPTRPVDVIYLRSFRIDRQSWKTVHRLRRALRGQLRLTGIVDPDESRRWYYLLYWLVNPFMFALGDFGRVNATRHNMFLEGNWKEGVKIAFSSAGAAVFHCRTLTENLLWEIGTGLQILGPERTLFIIPDEACPTHFQASLAASGIREGDLGSIPGANYAHESGMIALADRLRVLLAAREV